MTARRAHRFDAWAIVSSVALVVGPLPLWSAQSGPPSERLRQYLALGQASLEKPITPAELGSAVSSPSGVTSIRALFERSIAEALRTSDRLVVPELGGEAMLDEGIAKFVVYEDPVHPIVREMAGLSARPGELLEFLSSSSDGQALLKETGGLHALLWQLSTTESKSASGEDGARSRSIDLLESIIDGAISANFRTWTADPRTQAAGIESTEWRGRYLGFWHLHPPRVIRNHSTRSAMSAVEFVEGIEPSHQDMTNAVELGQFLTIVFQPNGFDVYDLAALGRAQRVDLSQAMVIRHRESGWSGHFLSLVSSAGADR